MQDPHAPMPTAARLAEPLRSRWSPSVFDDGHELAPDELELLLRAAQWAPSRGNRQPWAFFVAVRGDKTHRALTDRLSRGNAGWVPRASAVLVAVAVPDLDDPEGAGYAAYDLGQAAAHVTLQARAMGLHAHQFAGFDREGLAGHLGVPPHARVMSGIAVGVPGDPTEVDERTRGREERVRSRRPLNDFVHADAWGSPWSAS